MMGQAILRLAASAFLIGMFVTPKQAISDRSPMGGTAGNRPRCLAGGSGLALSHW
jgi:hypothetical protein